MLDSSTEKNFNRPNLESIIIKITLIEKPGSLTHGWSEYNLNIGIAVGFFYLTGCDWSRENTLRSRPHHMANENQSLLISIV